MEHMDDLEYREITNSLRDQIIADKSWGHAGEHIRLGPECFSIGAFVGEDLVGFISAFRRPLPPPLADLSEAFINIIVVRPSYQRRGIGSSLLQQTVQWARQHRLYQVSAWSTEDRIEAIGLWRKAGFGFRRQEFEVEGRKGYGFWVVLPLSHD